MTDIRAPREFHRCDTCRSVFVSPDNFLPAHAEKTHYDFHQNNSGDNNYRQFLNRLFLPMTELLNGKATGLDFGSGPGPTLSVMFEEHGYSMNIFDYFYARDQSVFAHQYDFITCTEVLEHLHHPRIELVRLWDHLKIHGYFGIMTQRIPEAGKFADWYYKNDPTHVHFYANETIQWLVNFWNARIVYQKDSVVVLQKQE